MCVFVFVIFPYENKTISTKQSKQTILFIISDHICECPHQSSTDMLLDNGGGGGGGGGDMIWMVMVATLLYTYSINALMYAIAISMFRG